MEFHNLSNNTLIEVELNNLNLGVLSILLYQKDLIIVTIDSCKISYIY